MILNNLSPALSDTKLRNIELTSQFETSATRFENAGDDSHELFFITSASNFSLLLEALGNFNQ